MADIRRPTDPWVWASSVEEFDSSVRMIANSKVEVSIALALEGKSLSCNSMTV